MTSVLTAEEEAMGWDRLRRGKGRGGWVGDLCPDWRGRDNWVG